MDCNILLVLFFLGLYNWNCKCSWMYHSKLDVIVSTAIYIYICIFDYKIGFCYL